MKREIYYEGKYLNEFSVGLAASHGALIDPKEPIKVVHYLITLMNQIERNVAYVEARKRIFGFTWRKTRATGAIEAGDR